MRVYSPVLESEFLSAEVCYLSRFFPMMKPKFKEEPWVTQWEGNGLVCKVLGRPLF